MKNRISVLVLLTAFCITGIIRQVNAYSLLGTTGRGGTISTLVEVDQTTGTTTPIGTVGFAVSGMDWYSGKLYAVTSQNDPAYHGPIEINPATGLGTPIGTGWGGSITTATIAELAIDSNGNAFGWGEPTEHDLYQIDLITGTASLVGDSGIDTERLGLAFDMNDDLFLVNFDGETFGVNTISGAATNLGTISNGGSAHHCDIDPTTGILFGISDTITEFPELVSVDLNTFTVISSIPTDPDLHTLAFVPVAPTLFGTIGRSGTISTLVEVDQITGAILPLGSVGFAVSGMDWHDGNLYAVTSLNDPSYHGLIEIDPATGTGTPIGSGWAGSITSDTIAEMAIDSNGNAYGWGEASEDDLYQIDLTTGTATRIGESGLGTAKLGLAFDLNDNLFLINNDGNTYGIDTATGSSSLMGTTNPVVVAHHGDVDPVTGIYIGLSDHGEGYVDLVSIELGTLSVTTNVNTDFELHTLAFASVFSQAPTPLDQTRLLGTTGRGGTISTLVEIDQTTGAIFPIGSVGFAVSGLDWLDGRLYAVTSQNDPVYHGLIEIDPATGVGTPIGSGWGSSITATTIAELAIDSNGNAYGWGEPYEDDLYQIDLATGTAARIGESGLETGKFGLAFDTENDLFLINSDGNVYDIDHNTGSSSHVGTINPAIVVHHGDVDPATEIYAGLSGHDSGTVSLNFINPDTLALLTTVNTDYELHTLAFALSSVYEKDSFGYTATNTEHLLRNVSGSGTQLYLFDDEVSDSVCIPFNFNFYGQEVSELFISSNGFITFTPNSYDGCCSGSPIPYADGLENLVAGFWTDLDPDSEFPGTIAYQILGASPQRELVVGFYNIESIADSSTYPRETFEIILHEGSCNIELQYESAIQDGGPVTVGIENSDGTDGIQIFHDTVISLANQGYLITHPCPYRMAGDVNFDCVYDLLDFSISAQNWLLDCSATPGEPGCMPY